MIFGWGLKLAALAEGHQEGAGIPGSPPLPGLLAGEEVNEVAEALDHPGAEGPVGHKQRHGRLRVRGRREACGVTVSVISSPVTGQAEVTCAGTG